MKSVLKRKIHDSMNDDEEVREVSAVFDRDSERGHTNDDDEEDEVQEIQQSEAVKLGPGSDALILRLMSSARRDPRHRDLTIVCREGATEPLRYHRVVLGAASAFLRDLMQQAAVCHCQDQQQESVLCVPDVGREDMRVAVQFLYTGEFRMRRSQVEVTKEILEDVLRIDAQVQIPDAETIARMQQAKNRRPSRDDDYDQDGSGSSGHRGRGSDDDNGDASSSDTSSSKRRRTEHQQQQHHQSGRSANSRTQFPTSSSTNVNGVSRFPSVNQAPQFPMFDANSSPSTTHQFPMSPPSSEVDEDEELDRRIEREMAMLDGEEPRQEQELGQRSTEREEETEQATGRKESTVIDASERDQEESTRQQPDLGQDQLEQVQDQLEQVQDQLEEVGRSAGQVEQDHDSPDQEPQQERSQLDDDPECIVISDSDDDENDDAGKVNANGDDANVQTAVIKQEVADEPVVEEVDDDFDDFDGDDVEADEGEDLSINIASVLSAEEALALANQEQEEQELEESQGNEESGQNNQEELNQNGLAEDEQQENDATSELEEQSSQTNQEQKEQEEQDTSKKVWFARKSTTHRNKRSRQQQRQSESDVLTAICLHCDRDFAHPAVLEDHLMDCRERRRSIVVKGEVADIDDDGLEIEDHEIGETPSPDHLDVDDDHDVDPEEGTSNSSKVNAAIFTAPRVISKHPSQSNPSFVYAKKSLPPEAPKIVAKKTGGRAKRKSKHMERTDPDEEDSSDSTRTSSSSSNTSNSVSPEPPSSGSNFDIDSILAQDGGASSHQNSRPNPDSQTNLDTQQEREGTGRDVGYAVVSEDGGDIVSAQEREREQEQLLELPNPFPQPPEADMVIYRGKWIKASKRDQIRAKRIYAAKPNQVRRYNYTPFITISGKAKQSTVDRINTDRDGEHPCPHCDAKFSRLNSLASHLSRNHNHHNHKAFCPECGKGLSGQSAIKKHLLSHRPREEWPYVCPLCLITFQAKGDLPKHLMTNKHKNDPRVPPIGTQEWKALMDSSVRIPQVQLMNQRAREAANLVANPNLIPHNNLANLGNGDQPVVEVENDEEEEEMEDAFEAPLDMPLLDVA